MISNLNNIGEFQTLISFKIDSIFENLKFLQNSNWDSLLKSINLKNSIDSSANSNKLNNDLSILIQIDELTKDSEDLIRKFEYLSDYKKNIMKLFDNLNTCKYYFDNFANIISNLNNQINNIYLQGFNEKDVKLIINKINSIIAIIISERCNSELKNWNFKLLSDSPTNSSLQNIQYHHKLTIIKGKFLISPPIESTKVVLLNSANEIMNVCLNQTKLYIESEILIDNNLNNDITKLDPTFGSMVIDNISDDFNNCLESTNKLIEEINTYSNNWQELMMVWNLNENDIESYLGNNLNRWLSILKDSEETRDKYDTVETSIRFGSIVIDFVQAQNRLNNQFDGWQSFLTKRISELLFDESKSVHSFLKNSRKSLESIDININDVENTVKLINIVYNIKDNNLKLENFKSNLNDLEMAQNLLINKLFRFPSNWIYFEQISSDLLSLNELLEKRVKYIDNNISSISKNLKFSLTKVSNNLNILKTDWNNEKPIGDSNGLINSVEALRNIDIFLNKLNNLITQREDLNKTFQYLNIPIDSNLNNSFNGINEFLNEINDLKSVWSSISVLSDTLNNLNDLKWTEVKPIDLKKLLDDLLQKSRDMPTKVRQYITFIQIQNSIKKLIKSIPIITSLKNESLSERHWNELFSQIKFSQDKIVSINDLKFGSVLSLDLSENSNFIKKIIQKAQGEKNIELKINSIESIWDTLSFELFYYDENASKYRLVKNWDEIFQKVNDDLNTLSLIQNSPYYLIFNKRVSQLLEKLDKIHILLDTWIDVQRIWVYLNGVFNKNEDIRSLLPIENSRFNNITSELFSQFKKCYKTMLVIDILYINDFQETLEKSLEILQKIRKALLGYLEKQRELWPRYYFLGNEDLLEMIGNANDFNIISKHIKKLFQNVSGLNFDNSSKEIRSVYSIENEELVLIEPVKTTNLSLHEWLTNLEMIIKESLSSYLYDSLVELESIWNENCTFATALPLLAKSTNQVLILSAQVLWTKKIEQAINNDKASLETLLRELNNFLNILTSNIIIDDPHNGYPSNFLLTRKIENLIIESIHVKDILSKLINTNEPSINHFNWISQQRYYYDIHENDFLSRLYVKQGHTVFKYGFDYIGASTRLIHTPLVETGFVALTEALNQRLGGSFIGPAGTGKTESIKSLGQNLGRMVLVFCCDESFDYQSVSRILVGICRVGAWACFDEFNRLDESMLSAVSTQIEKIEDNLQKNDGSLVQLIDTQFSVNPDSGIFITSNPNYSGRSELPDNLKNKYRTVTIMKPETLKIAEVLLISKGFTNGSELSKKIVPFFETLGEKCSNQSHYDFGLRALKSTLINCGLLKSSIHEIENSNSVEIESVTVVKSLFNVVLPKLVPEDETIFEEAIKVFGDYNNILSTDKEFVHHLEEIAKEECISIDDSWVKKCLQINEIQKSNHGFMLVGNAGSGKTTFFNSVIAANNRSTSVENIVYRIDPKILGKDTLYGSLDYATRDWKDGIFTSILRRVEANLKGEQQANIWIVFDGDVDPNWVENLNSVLDDNKLLSLPNGERIMLSKNIKIVFEVENLNHATLATVSRCGIVWIGDGLVTDSAYYNNFLSRYYKPMKFEDLDLEQISNSDISLLNIQQKYFDLVKTVLPYKQLIQLVDESSKFSHIMEYNRECYLDSIFAFLEIYFKRLVEYTSKNVSFAFEDFTKYVGKCYILSLVWGLTGDCCVEDREKFLEVILNCDKVSKFKDGYSDSLLFSEVSLPDCSWVSLESKVPEMIIESHMVVQPEIIIPTIDTTKHEELLSSLLNEHRNLVLCGPPGSGKSMTLMAALRKSSEFSVASLNLSKDSSPELILKTLEQHCVYKKSASGTLMLPAITGKWLVLFCDEINLPSLDEYGTQSTISFLRQISENHGFWHPKSGIWITIENFQFVGACNPPTDPGRNALSLRFLQHCSVFMVDYPSNKSLDHIYTTFNHGVLKNIPDLRGFVQPLTEAMITVYNSSRAKFNTAQKAHYIYSPRELTRWVRGIYEAIKPLNELPLLGLIRLWGHEGLRLFSDRLSEEEDRTWTYNLIKETALKSFPHVDVSEALRQPILYSDWLSHEYLSVDDEELKNFVNERLRVFNEEEINASIVLYQDLLDHILRIDRVLKNPQGHLILVGLSGSGKTSITKFVAWINGIHVFQLSVSSSYTLADFDNTLRRLLKKAGVNGEKVCFIVDESTILDPTFLERMNTLLANAEVPGLYEGEDFNSLMSACAEASQSQNLYLGTDEELYQWFIHEVAQNFHVVFTISDPYMDGSPQIISSPALYNRCVINWMGDWSDKSFVTVTKRLLNTLPLTNYNYTIPETFKKFISDDVLSFTDVLIDCFVYFHGILNERMDSKYRSNVSPTDYMNFINNFIKMFNDKEAELQDFQHHINVGLDKLRDTVLEVKHLKETLISKKEMLAFKDKEARLMLDKMITDQNEAERKQEASFEIQKLLESQNIEIEARKQVVLEDLDEVEPLIEEAQNGVKNIKKQHLNELRALSNPPDAIKMTLEAVCIMLGYDTPTWRDVQMVIRGDDFIASIVNFDGQKELTKEVLDYMDEVYLSRPNFTFEAVNRASKACGPLVLWVKAQLKYSMILDKVEPLRQEVLLLEEELFESKNKRIAIEGMIKDLQDNIEFYKDSYSGTIRDAENIKSEMLTVETKVNTSVGLLENLTGERSRWESNVKQFRQQRANLIGDVLLGSAFISYCGVYDSKDKYLLERLWKAKLRDSGIEFDNSITSLGRISVSTQQLDWERNGLPNDESFFENAAIIDMQNRYSYIIDPSGTTVDFLKNHISSNQLVISSFLDKGFIRQLENCIRFGGTILILDGEYFDPIISRLLNREIERNGGRELVYIGENQIDLSPDFNLFIHTKDPSISIPSFIGCRMDILNFTFSMSTLEKQALNLTLKCERPEVEERRIELVKAKGEYKERLRSLENDLLLSLNDPNVNILENEKLIEKLKSIKHDAQIVNEKMVEAESIMDTVEQTSNHYMGLSTSYSALFSLLDNFHLVSPTYVFSSDNLFEILNKILISNRKQREFDDNKDTDDSDSAINKLILLLYEQTYKELSISLLQKDKSIFGLLLFSMYYVSQKNFSKESIMSFIRSIPGKLDDLSYIINELSKISNEGEYGLVGTLKPFISLIMEIDDDKRYETELNTFLSKGELNEFTLKDLIVSMNLNTDIMDELNVTPAAALANKMKQPIILRTAEGFDESIIIRNLSLSFNKKVQFISMGSDEGELIADQLIEQAIKDGSWIVVQNIHMSHHWVNSLLKFLQDKINMIPKDGFKIFLTCGTLSKLPIPLERSSKIVVFENDPGIKQVMRNILFNEGILAGEFNNKVDDNVYIEKNHIYFLLVWLYSIVQERLRFVPVAWKKRYDFNTMDLITAKKFIDECFSEFNGTKISIDALPWEFIQFMIGRIIFGGKIDDAEDLKWIIELSERIFNIKSFDITHNLLINTEVTVHAPEGRDGEQYLKWIDNLPDIEPVEWLSISQKDTKKMRVEETQRTVKYLLDLMNTVSNNL
ncbi:hypothetical protein B5S28_g4867 [[Candida] boidinii]|nr:hypothetical protein B5S28_g4867 [[Candida] boidinii]